MGLEFNKVVEQVQTMGRYLGHRDDSLSARLELALEWFYAADDLDYIHERIRLAIVSALAVNPALTFNDLKQLLGTTDGNLSVHARKLEEARYITCVKSFQGRVPRTEFRLTEAGRKALARYLDHMEALIRAARRADRVAG